MSDRGAVTGFPLPPAGEGQGEGLRVLDPSPAQQALGVRVLARQSPFSLARSDGAAEAGLTVEQIVAGAIRDPALWDYARVSVADAALTRPPVPVPRAAWRRVRPKPGSTVQIVLVPAGGGGKNPFRIILSLAIIAASFFLGPQLGAAILGSQFMAGAGILGLTAAQVASALGGFIITAVGTLLVNALIPPPRPALSQFGSGSRTSPTLSVTGIANRATPYGPVVRVYGRHRLFPVFAARPFTEGVGSEQYLRALFDFGYGPLSLSDLRIGTVPISQFDAVEMQVRAGWPDDPPQTLYPQSLDEDGYAIRLFYFESAQVQTRDATREAIVDITFIGLIHINPDDGTHMTRSVDVKFDYRAVGAGTWTAHATRTYSAASDQRLVYGERIVFPSTGRWEILVTRINPPDPGSDFIRDETWLTAVRSVSGEYPIAAKGRCLIAVRIKATDQLAGQLDSFNAVAQAHLPVWSGSAWTVQATRNPAWAYLDVLRGSANRRAVSDDRLDLPAFLDWAASCDAAPPTGAGPRWEFNGVYDFGTTVFEALRDIAAAGRAAPAMRDGKFSIVRDVPQSTPIQHFSPRNSRGFSGRRAFVRQPHAIVARYIEPAREWSQQEVTVYADGQSAATATEIEHVERFGCTNRDQAWRDTRYDMAVARLRPDTYQLTCDIEHLLCTRGDLVRVTHDVPKWGISTGRITGVTADGAGDVTAITLDEPMPMDAGGLYAVRIRRADASSVLASVVTEAGEQRTLTLAPAIPAASAPAAGDLVLFGAAGSESVELLVREIRPGPDLEATLVLVDAAPGVHAAEAGTIPPYDPQATEPPRPARPVPLQPWILSLFSDSRALALGADGTAYARIGVELRAQPTERMTGLAFQLRWRRSGSGEPWRVAPATALGVSPAILFTERVEEAIGYDVAARTVAATGDASTWTAAEVHVVIGKTALPGDVTGLAASLGPALTLAWTAVPDADLADYVVREGASWEAGSSVYQGLQNSVSLPPRAPGSYTFWVRARDTGGRESAIPASLTVEIAGPAALTAQALVESGAVRLSWTPPAASFALARTEIRRGADPDAPADSWVTGAAVLSVPVTWQGAATFWLRAVDLAGTAGPWAQLDVPIAVPGTPGSLRAEVIDNTVLLRWQAPAAGALPIRSYGIWRGPEFAAAIQIGEKQGTFTTIEERVGGSYTYWVAGIDSAGNVGAVAQIAAQVNQPPDYQLQDEFVSALGGTLTSAVIELGRVILPVDPAETWQEHFDDRLWAHPQDQIDAGYPVYVEPSPASGSYQEVIDYGTVLPQISATIEIPWVEVVAGGTLGWTVEVSDDGIGWTLVGTDVPTVQAASVRYLRLTVTVTRGATRGLVSLGPPVVRLETKIVRAQGKDTVTTAATGKEVLFSSVGVSFVDVRSITVTPRGTAARTAVVDFSDAPNPTGFTVYLFDASGTAVTGGFTWDASGV